MLARRAALLAARANLGGASAPALDTAVVRVVGFAWYEDDTPVEYPSLQMRNLLDGAVVARTTGTALGEFRFDSMEGGSYLIELLDASSQILAVGQPLTVLPGETVGTFIRLNEAAGTGEVASFAGSAPDVVQTAADAQVTAIGGGFPASNEG